MSWLLDTDVICQPAKRHSDARVTAWLEQEKDKCYTSAVVKSWSRREALGFLGVAGAALSSACNGDTPTSPTSTTTTTTPTPKPSARSRRSRISVTQIAFPEDITGAVYRTGVYASSGQNPTTNSRDNVFSDGVANELITITGGDTTSGYTGTFQVGIALEDSFRIYRSGDVLIGRSIGRACDRAIF